MKTYETILQGSEAVESFAIDFAQGYDFSGDEIEEYIDTVNGVEIYYNQTADYYFFSPS